MEPEQGLLAPVRVSRSEVKLLDLSSELVVLDWIYEPTLDHLAQLIAEAGRGSASKRHELARFSCRLALRLPERVGYWPLTRPTLLRIGFRDICRDLDLHEGTSVRIVAGPGRILRAHLDYDGNALLFRTTWERRDPEIEKALMEALPRADTRRLLPATPAVAAYQVRLPLPLTLEEARASLAEIRMGLSQLVAHFEPDRYRSLQPVLATFGSHETLAQLHLPARIRYAAVRPAVGGTRPVVH